jgi:hypothetical protein
MFEVNVRHILTLADWGAHRGLTVNDFPFFYLSSLLVSPRLEELLKEHVGLREALENIAPLNTDEDKVELLSQPFIGQFDGECSQQLSAPTIASHGPAEHAAPGVAKESGPYVFDWGQHCGHNVNQVGRLYVKTFLASPKLKELCEAHEGLGEALEAWNIADAQRFPHPLPSQQLVLPIRPPPQYHAHLFAPMPWPNNVIDHPAPTKFTAINAQTAPLQPYTFTYGTHKGKRFDEVPPSVLQGLDNMIRDPNNTTLNYLPGLVEAFKREYLRGFTLVAKKPQGFTKAYEKQPGLKYAVKQHYSQKFTKVDGHVRFYTDVDEELQNHDKVDKIPQEDTKVDEDTEVNENQLWQNKISEYKLEFGAHKGKHIDEVPTEYAERLTTNTDFLERYGSLKHVLRDWSVRVGRSINRLEKTLKRRGNVTKL